MTIKNAPMLKKSFALICLLVFAGYLFLENYTPPLSDKYGHLQTRLYLGQGDNQPLIVGFGGSEGGNAWDSDYWKPTRDSLLSKGYAFLAIGYFGTPETPATLDRISLDAIYDTIVNVAQRAPINQEKIAIIGGSKGGELVLNLASYFDDIDAVVALSTSHVSFPAITSMSNTSSWMLNDEELPFVPTPYAAVPDLISGNILEAYHILLDDKEAVAHAVIPVENIKGSILIMSATKDEMWPSTPMSHQIIARLNSRNFEYEADHIMIAGGHTSPIKHFDKVFAFLDVHFPSHVQ